MQNNQHNPSLFSSQHPFLFFTERDNAETQRKKEKIPNKEETKRVLLMIMSHWGAVNVATVSPGTLIVMLLSISALHIKCQYPVSRVDGKENIADHSVHFYSQL